MRSVIKTLRESVEPLPYNGLANFVEDCLQAHLVKSEEQGDGHSHALQVVYLQGELTLKYARLAVNTRAVRCQRSREEFATCLRGRAGLGWAPGPARIASHRLSADK